MVSKKSRTEVRFNKHRKLRNRFTGTAERPRLAVFRSNNHMYAQIIDDTVGNTLVSASTLQNEVKSEVEKKAQALGEPIETRSQYKEMEERVIAEILPKALTQKHTISAYIDIKKQWLVIDASSAKKGSDLTSLLRKTLGSLSIIPYAPETVISTVMTHWLMHGFYSKAFTCLPEVEIKELSEAAGTVKIKGVDLTSEDVLNHVQKGWQVTKMAFDYQERLQFALGEDFIFKRMKYLDNFQEDIESQDEPLLYQQTSAHLMVKEYREFIQNFIDVIAGNER